MRVVAATIVVCEALCSHRPARCRCRGARSRRPVACLRVCGAVLLGHRCGRMCAAANCHHQCLVCAVHRSGASTRGRVPGPGWLRWGGWAGQWGLRSPQCMFVAARRQSGVRCRARYGARTESFINAVTSMALAPSTHLVVPVECIKDGPLARDVKLAIAEAAAWALACASTFHASDAVCLAFRDERDQRPL